MEKKGKIHTFRIHKLKRFSLTQLLFLIFFMKKIEKHTTTVLFTVCVLSVKMNEKKIILPNLLYIGAIFTHAHEHGYHNIL